MYKEKDKPVNPPVLYVGMTKQQEKEKKTKSNLLTLKKLTKNKKERMERREKKEKKTKGRRGGRVIAAAAPCRNTTPTPCLPCPIQKEKDRDPITKKGRKKEGRSSSRLQRKPPFITI
jgi:hypothetical protein